LLNVQESPQPESDTQVNNQDDGSNNVLNNGTENVDDKEHGLE
jgi:hypothetical protein